VSKKRSGTQRATDNVAAFESYWTELRTRGEYLPLKKDGDVNLSQVAKDSGIGDRGRLYTNDRLRQMLDTARAETLAVVSLPPVTNVTSSQPVPDDVDHTKVQRLERRTHRLEQQNSALVAENAELRRQLRDLRLQMGREDLMIETGRRVPSPVELQVRT
jgi:hypothetical protein